MDVATLAITKGLKQIATKIEPDCFKIKDVAKISANGDEFISTLLYDIFKVIGKDGIVNVNDSTTLETHFEIR